MKTLSMIFWFYHLFDVNLSSNFEIKTQKRKDGGPLTAEHRSGSRNQRMTHFPTPSQAALTSHSCTTLHHQLSVRLSLHLSMCSFCSPTRMLQRNPGLTCLTQQHPECPDQCLQAVTAQRHIRAWLHNSTLLFYRLPQVQSFTTQCWVNYKITPLGSVTHVSVLCLWFTSSSRCFLWLWDPFLQI